MGFMTGLPCRMADVSVATGKACRDMRQNPYSIGQKIGIDFQISTMRRFKELERASCAQEDARRSKA